MNQLTTSRAIALPEPTTPIYIRPATMDDLPFMDALQKKHSKELGFFPRAQMQGYIDGGNVLVAVDATTGEKLGYVASKDRYLKRDELGAVFQLCVVPGHQRGFIGANLLREVFERSSYGCRLYCCWCAQDLAANRFWESMGFVPIAYRAGSAKKGKNGSPRVHVYWQKRIRAGDTSTPYWFPAKTEGGAIREDRIILPIPPGMHWSDELPILVPEEQGPVEGKQAKPGIEDGRPARKRKQLDMTPPPGDGRVRSVRQFDGPPSAAPVARGVAPAETTQAIEKAKKPRADRIKTKADPALIARARELRDRWMDHVAAHGIACLAGKYDVGRSIEDVSSRTKRLAA